MLTKIRWVTQEKVYFQQLILTLRDMCLHVIRLAPRPFEAAHRIFRISLRSASGNFSMA